MEYLHSLHRDHQYHNNDSFATPCIFIESGYLKNPYGPNKLLKSCWLQFSFNKSSSEQLSLLSCVRIYDMKSK